MGEPTREVLIGMQNKQVTKLSQLIPEPLQKQMETYLQAHDDVFTWQLRDILGIDPKFFNHKLNVDPHLVLVQQKRC